MSTNSSINEIHNSKTKNTVQSYVKTFTMLFLLAILATLLSYWINANYSLSNNVINYFQIFSLLVEATALGQCKNIQTWGRVSPAEKLDERLHRFFTASGIFLIILSLQLETTIAV